MDFVRDVCAEDALEENFRFVSDALDGKCTPREIIRNYFLKDFYKDHCSTHQKRPIYWMLDFGKKNGFKCLIYMHRYQPDLLVRVRTNYVHEQQERYRTQLAHLEEAVAQVDISQRVKLNKQIKKLNDQLAETITFGEKIHHLAEQMIAIGLRDKRDRFRHLYH